MKYTPVLAILVFILFVVLQLVNKFAFINKGKKTLSQEARINGFGFLTPLFEASAVDMFKYDRYPVKKILAILFYYLFVLGGLILSEVYLGHSKFLLILLIAIGIEFVAPPFFQLSCLAPNMPVHAGYSMCCGEAISWFYLAVGLSLIHLKTNLGMNMKGSSFLSATLSIILGLIFTTLYTGLYYYQPDKVVNTGLGCCAATTNSILPYLMGIFTTAIHF